MSKKDIKILNKSDIKKRNQKTKDYSKQLASGRAHGGPRGGGVYLGKKATNQRAVIKRVLHYLGRHKWGLYTVAIAITLSTLSSLLIPALFGYAIDNFIETKQIEGAYKIALIIVVIAVVTSLIRFVSRYTMTVISQKAIMRIRKDAFDKLQNLPVSYYDKNQSGDIVSRLSNDIELINSSLASTVMELIRSVITVVGALILMIYTNWALSIIAVMFIPIMAVITLKISKKVRKGFMAQQKHLGDLNSIIEEHISGIQVVKLYSQEEEGIKEFKEKNDELRNAGFKAQVYAGLIMPIVTFMNNLIYLLIVAVGGIFHFVFVGLVTVGNISAITQYARLFIQPISSLAQLFNTLQQGLAGAERVFELIDEPDEYQDDKDLIKDSFIGNVEFKNITFGYEEDKPVLHNISFNAKQGEVVAIVGPTGSGKTTIINLLNRFYDPQDGYISIDNVQIQDYKKNDLRKKIGVVLQDTSLFSGSVYENIHYGDLNASKEEVIEASKKSKAFDFISKLPNGFDAEVFEGGQNFSQGERQLISIARTILSNPDILILDEATSNVDTRTEKQIQESMHQLMKGRTSFVIAHRLQTIVNADNIIVIEDGKLIESGSHKELINNKKFYYDLYTTQFKI